MGETHGASLSGKKRTDFGFLQPSRRVTRNLGEAEEEAKLGRIAANHLID
jgi:hypothetical protein